MVTLYVSDLDGTLLNREEQIGDITGEIIHQCIAKGMKFTFATARSLISARKVTKGLALSGPVIVYNGAFIMDYQSREILYSQTFTAKEQADMAALLDALGMNPIVYSFINGVEKVSWRQQGKVNEGMRRYFSLRIGDPRMNPLPSGRETELYAGDVFYYTCIGEKEELAPLAECLKNDERYTCIFQQELYRPEYWCEILPKKATKAQAILALKEMEGCEKVISFGDAINDLPMFAISDECYAVENAVTELKAAATGIIGSNQEEGVARWLAERYLLS